MAIAYYLANKVLDHLSGRTSSVNLGGDAWVGLSTTLPAADGTNVTEPTVNGYARVLLGLYGESSSHKMAAAADGESDNDDVIYFPETTNDDNENGWGTCTHFVIYDASTSGNLLAFGALTSSITPADGEVALVRVGDLKISLT